MKNSYASVSWAPEDVVQLVEDNGGRISTYGAADFLARNEAYLRDRLIQEGWEILEDLLKDEANQPQRERGEDDGREYGHPGDKLRGID